MNCNDLSATTLWSKVLWARLRVALASDPSARTALNAHDSGEEFFKALGRTQAAWNAPFVGEVGGIFYAIVGQEANKFEEEPNMAHGQRNCYAKVMPVVQSSGAGKSRLIDRYGINKLGVIFTFRTGFHSGYPPGDPEILQLLDGTLALNSKSKGPTEHASVVSLPGSVFRERWCSETRIAFSVLNKLAVYKRLDSTPEEMRRLSAKPFMTGWHLYLFSRILIRQNSGPITSPQLGVKNA